MVTSPASETSFYTNTSSLCTITCDPTHSKSQTTHNTTPSQQILGSTSFNQIMIHRTLKHGGNVKDKPCPEASVNHNSTTIYLKQSLAQKRFPIRQRNIFIMDHHLRSTLLQIADHIKSKTRQTNFGFKTIQTIS